MRADARERLDKRRGRKGEREKGREGEQILLQTEKADRQSAPPKTGSTAKPPAIAIFRSAPYGRCLSLIRRIRNTVSPGAGIHWHFVIQPGLDKIVETTLEMGTGDAVSCHLHSGRFEFTGLMEGHGTNLGSAAIQAAYVPLNNTDGRGYWEIIRFLSAIRVPRIYLWSLDDRLEPVTLAGYAFRQSLRMPFEWINRQIDRLLALGAALYASVRFPAPGDGLAGPLRETLRRRVIRFLGRARQPDFTRYNFFHQVFIETRSRCNSTCSFCPVSVAADPREDRLMPEDLHEKIIRELAEMEFKGHLAYYNNNEPLLDKRLPEFIRRARSMLPGSRIRMLTNGLLLTEPVADQHFEAGLDWLSINAYDDRIKPRLRELAGRLSEKYPDRRVDYRDRSLREVMTNSGGTAPNKPALTEPIQAFCEYPFYQLIVNAQGIVPLCCRDAYYQVKMGDVRRHSLKDIWKNRQYDIIRKSLLRDDRTITDLCAKCDFPGLKSEKSPTVKSVIHRRLFRWACHASRHPRGSGGPEGGSGFPLSRE